MRVIYTPEFLRRFKRLSKEIQDMAIEKEKIFIENPSILNEAPGAPKWLTMPFLILKMLNPRDQYHLSLKKHNLPHKLRSLHQTSLAPLATQNIISPPTIQRII